MGIYFTLIATAAIPSLRETKLPDGFSSEKFEEQLEGLKWKDEAVNKLFPGRGTPSATGTDDQPMPADWSAARARYELEQNSLAQLYTVAYQTDYYQGKTLAYYKELLVDYRNRLVRMQNVLARCWLATHSKAADTKKPPADSYDRSMPAGSREDCAFYLDDEIAPTRAGLSAGLGPLGAMMNWLLASESLPLTLIVGLMGFGLPSA